jgi:hypothetical protein
VLLALGDSLIERVLQGRVMRSEGELRDDMGEVECWRAVSNVQDDLGKNIYKSDPDEGSSRDIRDHAR